MHNSSSFHTSCSTDLVVCEYLSPLPRISPRLALEGAFTQEVSPLSPDNVPLNLSCRLDSNACSVSKPFVQQKPIDIIRAVAQQELMKLKLSRLTNNQSDISVVNGDHDYDKIGIMSATEETNNTVNGRVLLDSGEDSVGGENSHWKSEQRNKVTGTKKARNFSKNNNETKTRKAGRRGNSSEEAEASPCERSAILRAETSIIATFIAKVTETKKRKSFGTTYHVIKPRAHLYLPNKCSKKVVQQRYDVPRDEIETGEELVGTENLFGSRSTLSVVQNCIDEQIQLQRKFISRWEALFKKINRDPKFGSGERAVEISNLTQIISEKNQAISESLDECKQMMAMIEDHKLDLIQAAQDWNSVHGY